MIGWTEEWFDQAKKETDRRQDNRPTPKLMLELGEDDKMEDGRM